uniref:F-box domain-containing protein n=1 Tax=Mycena chlorophos TaxID=658473 RepID=A0ABQ0LTQ3_MYCCL|nr:predicted protein [Mycena chlorophos]
MDVKTRIQSLAHLALNPDAHLRVSFANPSMDANLTRANVAPRLPLELLLLICNEASQGTLAVLSRTWRAFHVAALRHLWPTVDLRDRPLRVIRSWANVLTRNKHLAERIHTLYIALPSVHRLSPEDAVKISHAFVACTNLEILHFYRAADDQRRSLDWVLFLCSFRLTEFASSYFDDWSIRRFLAKQHAVRILHLAHQNLSGLEADEYTNRPALPNLIAIKAPTTLFPADRALQRIEMDFVDLTALAGLARHAQTLTTLNIVSVGNAPTRAPCCGFHLRQISDILPSLIHLAIVDSESELGNAPTRAPCCSFHLRQISDILPSLVHLAIVDSESARERYADSQTGSTPCEVPPSTLLSSFNRLETLVLVYGSPKSFTFASCGSSSDPVVVTTVAKDTLLACPTLSRAAIGIKVQKEEKMYIASRDSSGDGVQTVVEDHIDFEAVSMFWLYAILTRLTNPRPRMSATYVHGRTWYTACVGGTCCFDDVIAEVSRDRDRLYELQTRMRLRVGPPPKSTRL